MKQHPNSPGTVFWDFDGTLASRPNMWMEACIEILNEVTPDHNVDLDELKKGLAQGLPWHAPELSYVHLQEPSAWWRHNSAHFHTLLQRLDVGDNLVQITDQIRESIIDPTRYSLYEDVFPALDCLAKEGWRQIVVSNHIPELDDLVKGLGLSTYFYNVLSSARVGYEKPNPEIFNMALRLAIPDRPIWMIGDSEKADCLPAQELGIHAILVRRMSSEYEPKSASLTEAVKYLLAA